ncbi:16S rRNA (guanine(966)-N(2))-methyltransferase RsmD [Anaerorhabdus sp.]|uniref:16S rRNA (guanine(966)-N(2))-methyltransferase RsmD n=1 Tax=Anaerorhabdus sp. TaxID=1872524 RepID=UPI002B1FDB8E|nr:16S rRNA (guanine(966)-N(2))-methyltransferase RsmD [Anaerorhabdus sp.]MEA4873783.1 16S rRNA (guanine(966)-N(2))-methyltransferase RsmD [Anaerorhabdus sp.]
MRIVAGKHRSRILKTLPGENTRPTLDKVREGVFSSIGPYFDGGIVLDLFSGSGAIGLECISRGMDFGIFVDSNYDAIKVIQENIKALKEEERTLCLKMDYNRALQQCVSQNRKFDLIYLDPPYSKISVSDILTFIDENKLLNKDGVVISETLKDEEVKEEFKSFNKKKELNYGITKIVIFKEKEESV